MKIISIVGARPQFIKYSPLNRELQKMHQCLLIHTGQHYDYNMNKVFFDELGIPQPDYNLEVGSGTHAYQTGEMMKGIENILMKEKPDLVIIFGDTNSTLAGALSTTKLQINLAHVEAGLRVFDKSIPEEINRMVADYCSNYLFCPTRTAVDNLNKENLTKGVYLTGDVMVDALNFNKEIAERSPVLHELGLTSKQYILVTLHRPGNTDIQQNLEDIVNALIMLAQMGETIVFPVHPRTEKLLRAFNLYDRLKGTIKLTEPQGYLEFLKLLNHAKKVITDSGGTQKEAYLLKVPGIVLMETSPWTELVENGWNTLVGCNIQKVIKYAVDYEPPNWNSHIFGIGASKEIASIINDCHSRYKR